MKHFLAIIAFLTAVTVIGCDVNTPDIAKVADALDRFSGEVEKTTHPEKGNLKQLLNDASEKLRALIKDAEKSQTAITADVFEKFAKAEDKTFADILTLTTKVFGDTRILMHEFQGLGISIPLQLDDSLRGFQNETKKALAGLIAPVSILVPAAGPPLEYEGVTWSLRPEGYQDMWFAIPRAESLLLKIGDRLIAPDIGAKRGAVDYRVPIKSEDDARFDDTEEMGLPFELVDVTHGRKGDQTNLRWGGTIRLLPRFPLQYTLQVSDGNRRPICTFDHGPAIDGLVRAVSNSDPVEVAKRHGKIYRTATSRLAVGPSFASIPQGAYWALTVWFPDDPPAAFTPSSERRAQNNFGTVTVSGPDRDGDSWTLMVVVEPKKK